MNINDLTIGQVKEIQALLGQSQAPESDFFSKWIGKYVIARSYNEGVLFGKVLSCNESGYEMESARRLYYHKPLDTSLSWYEGVAQSGLAHGCRVSSEQHKVVIERYSFTECSQAAIDNISNYETHGQ
ncbi:MAG: hypothetical protein HRT61_00955 [Ekhidna sp.]|nr:hypothetical protein [Ekhidna sp.]